MNLLKNNKEKKMGKKANKIILILMVLFILLILFIVLPVFRIKQIEMYDVNFIQPESIYAVSGIEEGQHFLKGLGGNFNQFFTGHYGKAEEKVIENIPEIKNISIRYRFPGKVIFKAKEKIAIGWIKIPDGYCTVDGQGNVISIMQEKPDGLPIISSLTVVKASLGKKIEVLQNEYLETAMYTMSALIEADLDTDGEKLLYLIDKIEPTINNDIYIYINFPDQKLAVICGQSYDLKEDFIWLKQLIDHKVLANRGSGTIDLRGENRIFQPSDTNDIEQERLTDEP